MSNATYGYTAQTAPQIVTEIKELSSRMWEEMRGNPSRATRKMTELIHGRLGTMLDEIEAMADVSYLDDVRDVLVDLGFAAEVDFPGVVTVSGPKEAWWCVLGDNGHVWSMDVYESRQTYSDSHSDWTMTSPIACENRDLWPARLVAAWAAWRIRYWQETGCTSDTVTS